MRHSTFSNPEKSLRRNSRQDSEPLFQTIIAEMDSPYGRTSPEFASAFAQLNDIVTREAMFLLRRIPSYERRLDIAKETRQDFYVSLLNRGIKNYRQGGEGQRFAPYGIRILKNLIIDRWRTGKRCRFISLPDDFSDPLEENPVRSAEFHEFEQKCQVELAALSPRDRQTLILIYWENLSRCEVAVRMGTNPRTVATWAHRARNQLRDKFRDRGQWPL